MTHRYSTKEHPGSINLKNIVILNSTGIDKKKYNHYNASLVGQDLVHQAIE